MKKYYIYKLSHNDVVFYIGKTSDINRRLLEHLKEAKKQRNYKERHINKLLNDNKDIQISIIEEVDNGLEDDREKYWISHFKNIGVHIYNTSEGGEGGDNWSGKTHSIETKKKLSKIRYQQIEKGMIYKQIGEKNGRSKLTSDKVLEIRRLRESDGISYGKLGIMFGVSKNTVMDIIKYNKWKHV